MCSVPNAFACKEIKAIIRILSFFTRFLKQTAIVLNTNVYIYLYRYIDMYVYILKCKCKKCNGK